ncbi:NIPSNAP family protein [Amycolatopsis cynarae]|uniref:NIPSNAP family protein n=1 Tax=Amycolatopsis cynarae TaxID=2995223 RepID=A0ABY7BBZ9_9PSEU|nr:NIPSNAP family protein [Amycolatopsis sp. HUAS 11-8]WAL68653.1 NIPSNAP family protein [Amycolatopsis sp. HUAS 11-8]
MLYELSHLAFKLYTVQKALSSLEAYTSSAGTSGKLLGCWETEHGVIVGRVLLLREFEDADALAGERQRILTSSDPFGVGEYLESFRIESYAPFPFVPPVQTGRFGDVYEFRTYELRVGGLLPTMAGWEAALPERTKLFPLTTAMYGLDGVPRITHIWPFPDLNERLAIRRESYQRGIWPPENGPENIAHATSTIAIPTAFSPLH